MGLDGGRRCSHAEAVSAALRARQRRAGVASLTGLAAGREHLTKPKGCQHESFRAFGRVQLQATSDHLPDALGDAQAPRGIGPAIQQPFLREEANDLADEEWVPLRLAKDGLDDRGL